MSYSIALYTYQTNTAFPIFSIVEETVWYYANGGIWSPVNDTETLILGGSGTSGTLRFRSESDMPEYFIVVVGVDNFLPWCDIVAGLASNETGMLINPEYYNGTMDGVREQHNTDCIVTSPFGTTIEVMYTVANGTRLEADIIIG